MTTPDLEAGIVSGPLTDAELDKVNRIGGIRALITALHAATQERDQQAARVGALEAALESALALAMDLYFQDDRAERTMNTFVQLSEIQQAIAVRGTWIPIRQGSAASALAAPRAEVE